MSDIDEIDALLDGLEDDVVEEAIAEEVSQAAEEIIVEELVDEDDLLEEAIRDADIAVIDEKIAKKESEAEPDMPAEGEELTIAEKSKKTVTAAARTRSKGLAGLSRREAIMKVIGGEENAKDFFVLEPNDADLDPDILVDRRLSEFDRLAKKVGEKLVNAFSSLNNKATLSTYTEMAIKALIDNGGVMTSSDLISSYANNPSKALAESTAKAQANQMMQLLPALRVAKKAGSKLTLNEDSVFLEHFKAAS